MKMTRWERSLYGLNPWVLSSVAGVITVSQLALCLFRANPHALPALKYLGYVIWGAGAVFGILPIFTLRGRGGVAKGRSYVHTTALVDSGVYAMVRHPQGGVAWLLLNLGLMLIGQTWPIAILGIASMVLVYLDALKADQYAVEKFGDDYRRYMESVPRLNLVLGILRLVRRRRLEGGSADDQSQRVN